MGAGRHRSVLVIGLVVLLGVIGTALAAVTLHLSARAWTERAFTQKQDVITKVVYAELVQYGVALADLSASLGAQPALTGPAFSAITAAINGERLPGAVEVTYVVPATATTTADIRADWRSRGGTDITPDLTADADGSFYLPVLGRPLDGGAGDVHGGTQTTQAIAALQRARTNGGVTTSATFHNDADRSFIMAAAVHATTPATEAGQFRGWVTMTFRGSGFLGTPVGLIGGDQVDVEFADISGGTPVTLATWQSGAPTDHGLPARSFVMPSEHPQWQLTIRPTVRLLPSGQSWHATAAVTVGGVITVLLATLTAAVVTSRDRALRQVDQATSALRHDIQRRESVEQQLRRREEELVGFAGVVAHDLRNPLTNVIGFAELISVIDDGDLSDKQHHYLTRVRGSAALMQHLIDDLLAYATADNTALRITDVHLDDLVDSILEERVGHGTGGTPPAVERHPLPTVLGDPTLVRQVLDNLIGNAIKYTPTGRAAEITIRATTPGPTSCRIEIADRGIGIPEEQRTDVFNAFTRADGSERYAGTGLGLAIVQRIIERHGGTVGVDAHPGGGSIFWFTLPTPAHRPAALPGAVLHPANPVR
ncbi:sensor histidine kinase [Actinoplanes subglobosus]|uniref:Sensor-like histidine kinase SenX3 n=1 Tax=Actinoplanes subglobosus TaxID=1547892 RepID=A0ABV8IUE7_9ACTN